MGANYEKWVQFSPKWVQPAQNSFTHMSKNFSFLAYYCHLRRLHLYIRKSAYITGYFQRCIISSVYICAHLNKQIEYFSCFYRLPGL